MRSGWSVGPPVAMWSSSMRPDPRLIVSPVGRQRSLDKSQLAAVIAHVRAHLRGRHAHIVAAVRGLAAALPRITFFAAAASEIGSLLEMCADHAAARKRPPAVG